MPLKVALPASDPRAARETIALPELTDLGLEVFGDPDSAGVRGLAVRACRDAGFEPRILVTTYPYTLPDVAEGRAFALRPDVPGIVTEGVAFVALEPPAPAVSVELVTRSAAGGRVGAFAELARAVSARVFP
jgi:hypothetical protein